MQDAKNVRVLVVDDEPNTLKACAATLKMFGVKHIVLESDSRRVMEIMAEQRIDVVLLDLLMPHISGMELLPLLQEQYPQLPVIVVTMAYELERAVECIRMGAFDYLVKPVECERLMATLGRAIQWQSLKEQLHALRDQRVDNRLDSPAAFDETISRNSKMRSICQYIEVVSRSTRPILITGESGTGKELVAPDLSSEAMVKPYLSHEELHKKLEDIWGHFPTLREAEECIINTALMLAGGNQGIAATMLGLKRQTLNMRLKNRKTRQCPVRKLHDEEGGKINF